MEGPSTSSATAAEPASELANTPRTPEMLSASDDLLQASPQPLSSPKQAFDFTPTLSIDWSPATSVSSSSSPCISRISAQCDDDSAPSDTDKALLTCNNVDSASLKSISFDRLGKQQDIKSACLQCRLAGLRCSFQFRNARVVTSGGACRKDQSPAIQIACTRCLRNDGVACIVEDLSPANTRGRESPESTDQLKMGTGGSVIDKPRYTAAGHYAVLEKLTYEGFGTACGLGGPAVVHNLRYSDRGGWKQRNKALIEALRAEREERREIEDLRHRRAREVAEALLAVEADRRARANMVWPHTAGRARKSGG